MPRDFNCPLCRGEQSTPTGLELERDYTYRRCSTCQLMSLFPMPTEAELKALYSDDYFGGEASDGPGYGDYASLRSARQRSFRRYVAELVSWRPEAKVLDVGCALGFFLEVARDAGLDVEGIDISSQAIETIRPTYGDRVRCCGIEQLAEERPGEFDALFLSDTLEHIAEPAPFIAAAATLLRPGGRLLALTPNERSLLARVSGRRWVSLKVPEHVVLYSPRTVSRLLAPMFDDIRVSTALQDYPLPLVLERIGQLVPGSGPLASWLAKRAGDAIARIPDGNLAVRASRR